MATIADRTEWIKQLARGKGSYFCGRASGPGSNTTAAAAASGFISAQVMLNNQGVTYPGTLIGNQLPPITSELLTQFLENRFGSSRTGWLARFYRFGTVNLAATGDQFTHDGTFTRLRRTRYGAANTNVPLIPLLYLTTATTTTAPSCRLRTVAGAAGYTDQDGNNTVAVVNACTLPAAATTINSAFIMRLNDGDSGVLNITNIEVTTAGATGAASIFGVELLAPATSIATGSVGISDNLFGGLSPMDLQPATPDAGSVTHYLGILALGGTATQNGFQGHRFSGALNA